LVSLLNDLSDLEETGLEESECRQVEAALAKMTNAATAVPDHSFWGSSIWSQFKRFEDIYAEWNGHEGKGREIAKARRASLQKLRSRRNKIASRIRKNQFLLQNELDAKMIKDLYEAFGALCNSLPELFRNVSRALSDIQKA
jgi:hypothetical protein